MEKILIPWIRKHLPKLAMAGAVMAMTGCATNMSTPVASLAACKGLTATTKAMKAIKPQLPVPTQQKVGLALNTAAGYCIMPSPPANANATVAGILNSLNSLATQVAQAKASATGVTKP